MVPGPLALAWFEAGRLAEAADAAGAAAKEAQRLGFGQHIFAADYLRVLAGEDEGGEPGSGPAQPHHHVIHDRLATVPDRPDKPPNVGTRRVLLLHDRVTARALCHEAYVDDFEPQGGDPLHEPGEGGGVREFGA